MLYRQENKKYIIKEEKHNDLIKKKRKYFKWECCKDLPNREDRIMYQSGLWVTQDLLVYIYVTQKEIILTATAGASLTC